MEKLKGYKTILFMVFTAALAAVDSLAGSISIPAWYYQFIVPAVGFVLRFLTDSAVGGAKD